MRKNMQSKASNCRSSATRSLKANAALGLSKAAVVALAAILAQGSVSGASTYWDGDGLGSVGGGAGYWNATLGRWSATAGGSSYLSFASGDTAVFGGSGGVVYTTAPMTANLDIQTNGYSFVQQSNTNQLIFPTSASVNVATGVSAELNSMGTLASGSTLTKTGGGTFFLDYALSAPAINAGVLPSNAIDIQNGTLALARHALYRFGTGAASINVSSVLGTNTAVNIGAAGVLNLGKFQETVGTLSGSGTIVMGSLKDQKGVVFAPNFVYGSTLRITKDSTFSGSIVDDGAVDPVNAPLSGGRLVIGNNVANGSFTTVTLSGANTFRGGTWVTQGSTLYLQGGNALSDNAPLVVNLTPVVVGNLASLIQLQADEKIGSLTAIGSGTAFVDPNGHTLTLGGDNTDTDFVVAAGGDIGGGILGADQGGKIVKVGTGTQFISPSGSITFSGKYEIKSGRMSFNSDIGSGVAASPVADFFKLDGGTLGVHGNATFSANKGITVTNNGGGLYASLISSGAFWGIQAPITGAGTLSRTGSGSITLKGDNSGFTGTLAISDGHTSVGSGQGALVGLGDKPAGTGSIDIAQSFLELTTDNVSAATDQSYNLASGVNSKLTFGPGTVVQAVKNGNKSLTVTIGNSGAAAGSAFTRNAGGSMLVLAVTGAGSLGTADGEKIIVNGGVTTTSTNGATGSIVPGVITSTSAAATEGYFTTYDSTLGVGLKIAAMSPKVDINTTDNTDIYAAIPGSTNLLAVDSSAYGLKVGTGAVGANLDLGGKTLTLGGATVSEPATVILGASSNINATGGGTLDFGAHEGVIYTELAAGTINGTVKGSGGLTKMGYGPLNFSASTTLSYTGATKIEQGVLNITAGTTNQLPVATDVVFAGTGRSATARPTLALNGATVTVNSINSTNRGAAFGATNFEGGPAIELGVNGTLKISGAGSSYFDGAIKNGTGAVSSTIVVDGGGTLQLGLTNSNPKDASAVAVYNKLKITNSSTVIVDTATNGSGSTITMLPSNAATTNDAITLDGGTLKFVGQYGNVSSGLGLAGSDASNSLPHKVNLCFTQGRGYTFGTGGGTINVDGPYNMVSFAGTSTLSASNGAITAPVGGATLVKTGSGMLQMMGSTNSAPTTVTGHLKLDIREGIVAVVDDASLGVATTTLDASAITINGGVLSSSFDTNLATTALAASRGITIGSLGGTITQGRAAFTIGGPLSGTGALRISQLAVANATTFSSSSDGTVAPTPFTGNVTLATGYQVWANANNALGTGQITNDPAYQVQFGTSVATAVTLSNAFSIVAGNGTSTNGKFDFVNTGTLTLTGQITGSAPLFKGLNYVRAQANSGALLQSAGALELANSANNFSGDFTVVNGTLIPTVDGALGATSAKVVVIGGNLGFKGNVNYTGSKPVQIGLGGIRNVADTNSFAGPITMMSSGTLTGTAGQLTLTGAIGGPADAVLRKAGVGTVVLAGANTYTGGTTVVSGPLVANKLSNGTLTITSGAVGSLSLAKLSAKSAVNDPSGTTKVPALSIGAGTAALDLTNNAFVEDYSGASTYATVLGQVKNGYNTGNWDGASGTAGVITSSSAAAQALTTVKTALIVTEATDQFSSFPASFFGETVDNTSTLIQYGLAGDATLDGKVNTLDFNMLAGNFNAVGTAKWMTGDFNYDTNVDSTDFNILAGNYANVMPVAAPGLGAVVPEPGSIMMIAAAATGLLARRSRRNGFQL